MKLSQLYPFILRADPTGTSMKELRCRYRRYWKYDRRSTGDARYAFATCLPRFPLISLGVVEYKDCQLVDGDDLALLIRHLLQLIDRSDVDVLYLHNPGFLYQGEMFFAVHGWRGTRDAAMNAGQWLVWCFDFLTLADLRELIIEVKALGSKKIAARVSISAGEC